MMSSNLFPEGFFPNSGCLIYINTVIINNASIASVTFRHLAIILTNFFILVY